MRNWRTGWALVLVVSVAGCRSGGTRVQTATDPASALGELVGQQRILTRYGDRRSVSAKRGESGPTPGCDMAVEIAAAAPSSKGVLLTLSPIGIPRVGDGRAAVCKERPSQILLTLEDVDAGSNAAVKAAVDGVLPAPDAFLVARGKTFDLAEQPAPKLAADPSNTAEAEARTLARKVKTWPKPLLSVEPTVRVAKGSKVRHEGELEFTAVVGADGRLYRPQVKTALSDDHEKRVQSVMKLWRFEPAEDGDKKAVAARYDGRTVFRIE